VPVRRTHGLRAVVVAGLLGAGFAAEPLRCQGVGRCFQAKNPATEIGKRVQVGKALYWQDRTRWEADGAIRHFRALVEIRPGQATRWSLVIRDPDYHAIQVLGPEDLGSDGRGWTRRIRQPDVIFDLFTPEPATGLAGSIQEVVQIPADAPFPYYSTQEKGVARWQGLFVDEPEQLTPFVRRLGDTVAFLMLSWGRTTWTCSGVVIAPDLLLTNWHCGGFAYREPTGELHGLDEKLYWDRTIYESAIIDLSWDGDDMSREYQCERVVADRRRDLALLWIRSLEGETSPPSARIRREPVTPGEHLTLIHHPEAQSKQVTVSCEVDDASVQGWKETECGSCVSGVPSVDFTHDCDSEAGSSGAPLFDADGRLVGLHHLGFPIDSQCHPTELRNRAVRGDTIAAFLDELGIELR
jgi:Trypsin-like peptidase domain